VLRQLHADQVRVDADAAEEVVEIMRDAGGQPAIASIFWAWNSRFSSSRRSVMSTTQPMKPRKVPVASNRGWPMSMTSR
jgi:hypothetical protein